jgi:hypothetical protein
VPAAPSKASGEFGSLLDELLAAGPAAGSDVEETPGDPANAIPDIPDSESSDPEAGLMAELQGSTGICGKQIPAPDGIAADPDNATQAACDLESAAAAGTPVQAATDFISSTSGLQEPAALASSALRSAKNQWETRTPRSEIRWAKPSSVATSKEPSATSKDLSADPTLREDCGTTTVRAIAKLNPGNSPAAMPSDVESLSAEAGDANTGVSSGTPEIPEIVQTGTPFDGPATSATVPTVAAPRSRPSVSTGMERWKFAAAAKHALPNGPDQTATIQILSDTPGSPVFLPERRTIVPASRSDAPLSPAASGALTAGPLADGQLPEKLKLSDFQVTRFEYKSETETSSPLLAPQMLRLVRNSPEARETKPVKLDPDSDVLAQDMGSQGKPTDRPVAIAGPEALQHVRLVFEPPPPPPVVRSVSMDIGDTESQVRVVIRERNGSLNVQFGSANERLRQDLQNSGPVLMRELQRNNPMAVSLDFSNFGSATDADSASHSRPQAKKTLKPNAEFADVAETAYLANPAPAVKSL